MTALEQELQRNGLELLGRCSGMSARGPTLMHNAALLEHFSAHEADTLGEAMLLVRAQPGQVLITEGQVGDWMLLLLSGTVDVTKRPTGRDGQGQLHETRSRLAVIRTGASVGEMSMLDGEPRYATCIAIETVEAGVLTRDAIGELIRQHPAVGAKLLVKLTQLLAQRLRNTSNQLVKALQQQAV